MSNSTKRFTVQDLLNVLNKVEDKTIPVIVSVEFGRSCIMVGDIIDGKVGVSDDPNDPNNGKEFVLFGEEDNERSEE